MRHPLEEAFVELFLAGVSTRCVSDSTEALMGESGNASTVSRLNVRLFGDYVKARLFGRGAGR